MFALIEMFIDVIVISTCHRHVVPSIIIIIITIVIITIIAVIVAVAAVTIAEEKEMDSNRDTRMSSVHIDSLSACRVPDPTGCKIRARSLPGSGGPKLNNFRVAIKLN